MNMEYMRGWIWIPPGDALPQAFLPKSDELPLLCRLAGVLLADEMGEACAVLESMLDAAKVSVSDVELFHGEPNTIDVLTWLRQLQDGTLLGVSEQQYYLLARSALALRWDEQDTVREALGDFVMFASLKQQSWAEYRRLQRRHGNCFCLDFRPADEVPPWETLLENGDLMPEQLQVVAALLETEPGWDEFEQALVSFVQSRMPKPALPMTA